MDQENVAERPALDPETAAQFAELAFARRDLDEFLSRHGDVDADKLMSNPAFLRFCGTRMGKESLADLYDDFLALVGDAGAAAVARARSRSARSTGGGSTGGVALTPGQKKALDAWNEEHPEMAMTAREFLGR